MVVYVDILLFVNTIINYAVLMTSEKLLKRDCRLYRILAGALTGSLFSLVIFAVINQYFILLLLRVFASAVITFITFGWHSKSEYFKALIFTTAVSILYCGFIILFYQIFKPPNMLIVNDVPYMQINPILLILLTSVIYICILLLHRLFSERIKNTVVMLKFTVKEKEYTCIAKIDTGCNLKEPFSSSPVIIVDRTIFEVDHNEPLRIIPYTTVNSNSFLYAVKAENVTIDKSKITKPIYIASSNIDNPNYRAIINSEIIR